MSGVQIPFTDSPFWFLIRKIPAHRYIINSLPLSVTSCKDLLDTVLGSLIWLPFSSKSFLWTYHSHKSWMSGHRRWCLCWYWSDAQYKTDLHQEEGVKSDDAGWKSLWYGTKHSCFIRRLTKKRSQHVSVTALNAVPQQGSGQRAGSWRQHDYVQTLKVPEGTEISEVHRYWPGLHVCY